MNTQVRINSVSSSLLKARFNRRKSNNRDRSMIKANSYHWSKRLSRFGFLLALHHPLSLGGSANESMEPRYRHGRAHNISLNGHQFVSLIRLEGVIQKVSIWHFKIILYIILYYSLDRLEFNESLQ